VTPPPDGGVGGKPRLVRFGVFELDLEAGVLRKRGVRVKLQEQPLKVLVLLVEQPGRVVTREELRQRLWPGVVVDFDHGLNAAINKLREALGDSADTPRFVETLPRRGYRFIHPAGEAQHGGASAPVTTPEPRPPGETRSRPWWIALTLLGVAVAVIYLTFPRRPAPAPPPITSVAVLALRNSSGDRAQDYLADGLTEELVEDLGRVSALRVLSAPPDALPARAPGPPSQLARELGVDAFLEGDVRRDGGRIKLNLALVPTSPERQGWSEKYDRELEDLLNLSKQVARDVASAVRAKVTTSEQAQLARTPNVSPEAFEAFQLGRTTANRPLVLPHFEQARAYLEEAIRLEPEWAPPHAALGELFLRYRGLLPNHEDARLQARQWAEEAARLDPANSQAHMVLAVMAQADWSWDAAERAYRRAVELGPSDGLAHSRFAMFLYAMCRLDEAVEKAERAEQLAPTSPEVLTWVAGAYIQAGQVERGIATAERTLALQPAWADASLVLGRTFVTQGKHERAVGVLRKALVFGRPPQVLGALAHAYARAGHREEALALVRELTPLAKDHRGYPQFGLIWAYAGLGDRDRAFAALERAYAERFGRLVWLSTDPLLEPLRSDPRFEELARRVGVPFPCKPGPGKLSAMPAGAADPSSR